MQAIPNTKTYHLYRAMQDSDSESTISMYSTSSSLSTVSATSSDAPGQTTKAPDTTQSRLLLLPYDIRSLILCEALPQQTTYRCPKCLREGNVWKLGNITPLLLCRQLYDESSALMYKNAKFDLYVDAQRAVFQFYTWKNKKDHRTPLPWKLKNGRRFRVGEQHFTQESADAVMQLLGHVKQTKIWPDLFICNMKDLVVQVHLNHDKHREWLGLGFRFQIICSILVADIHISIR